jgi:hypothetical protein
MDAAYGSHYTMARFFRASARQGDENSVKAGISKYFVPLLR